MKKVVIMFVSFLILFLSCSKEKNGLTDKEIAEISKMESTLKTAEIYNDSLIWCCDSSLTCDVNSKHYYDSLYHLSDDDFNENCGMYVNEEDDHKHHSHMDDGMMNHSDQDSHVDEMNQMMKEIEKSHINYHPN